MFATFTKRRALFVVVFALLYTAATIQMMVLSVGAAVSGFEPGEPRASEATTQLFDLLSGALMFPLVSLLPAQGVPFPWAYVLLFGNGVIWAISLVALWSAVARRVSRGASDSPAA